MEYFVYILLSEKDNKLYVGCTTNLSRRLIRHNSGHVLATKSRRPFSLIHQEIYPNKAEAFQRERFLKSLWSSRFKKKVLEKYRQNIQKPKG